MSNQNSIFAIARDSQESAQSFDGSTWARQSLPTSMQWRFIGGNIGKFAFSYQDLELKFTQVAYTITDGINWNAGTLPTNITDCIVATYEDSSDVYSSFNGTTWTLPASITYYQTCETKVCTKSIFSTLPIVYTRYITCDAFVNTIAIFSRVATFRRILTTAVSTSWADWFSTNNSDQSAPPDSTPPAC